MAHLNSSAWPPRPSLSVLAFLTAASALLSACGGWTDDEEPAPRTALGSTAELPTINEPANVGIPAAPSLGEVLVTDALSLRPMADEALWVYRGVRTLNQQTINYSSFKQTLKTADGFEERTSNPLTGSGSTRRLALGTAQVTAELMLPLAVGGASVRAIELRSPVRQGDQIDLGQAQGVVLSEDVDRDGKPDTLDWAAWSRVVSLESVELPELERSVRAVRVDLTVLSRVTRSGQPQPDAPSTSVESSWYAPGLGIVRSSRKRIAAGGAETVESNEHLQFWDGITQGVGLLPSSPVSVAGTSAAIGPWLALPRAAAVRGDQIFVLSDGPSGSQQSIVLSALDKRGRVMNSVEHSGLMSADRTAPQLIPLGDAVALVRREQGVLIYPDQLENFKLSRFDTRAQKVGRDVWLVDGALAGSLHAASDGETIWVTWVDVGSPGQTRRLMLQAFDAFGDVKSRVHVLDAPGVGVGIGSVQLAAQSGRVSVTWKAQGSDSVSWRAALGAGTNPPTVTTLLVTTAQSNSTTAALRPLLTPEMAAISWTQSLDGAGGIAAPRAMALSADGQPRRGSTGSLDQELLPLPTHAIQAEERMVTAAEVKRLLWAGAGTERLRGDTDSPDRSLSFATLDAGDAALAAAVPTLRLLRDSSPVSAWQGRVQALHSIVPLDDRWMIIGHDGAKTTVAILHRR